MTKKLSIKLFFLATIVLTSCNNQQTTSADNYPTIDTKAEAQKLNDLLDRFAEPSQFFTVSSSKPTQVKGKQGTTISIKPDDLATVSGEPLGKNIQIELKELTNQTQLLKSNAQTVSNGQLLVSGGAYYIDMTSDGKQLKFKEGKNMAVEFPKLTENEMFLFYGQRDSLGSMEWQQASDTFKTKPSQPQPETITKTPTKRISDYWGIYYYIESEDLSTPMTKEEKEKIERVNKVYEKVYEKVYSAVNINSFGWINCDRFLEIQNKTDLLVNFNPTDSISSANIYLVFKDINSVMQSYYFSSNGKTYNEGFSNIPVGYKVRLVAYTLKDEKVLSFASDIIVKDKQTLTLTMKETSDVELKKLLNN
jgi:hypothetical protein